MADRIYLHLGPPKTGTTYLQHVLWQNRELLEARGARLTLGRRVASHRYAVADLCGSPRFASKPAAKRFSWQRLADDTATTGGTAVVSDELLASATDEQAERAVASFGPTEVHVVATVRDLVRQLPSVWQQAVKFRDRRTLGEYLEWLSADDAPIWLRQDVPVILGRWRKHLPPEHLHVVTVPPHGAGRAELWGRFAYVLGIDPEGFDLDGLPHNPSLSAAQVEMLRRFNAGLDDRLPAPKVYRRSVSFGLLRELGDPDGEQVRLPSQWADWVAARAERMVAELRELGVNVVGDLDDLRTTTPETGAAPTEPEIAAVAIEALRAMVVRYDRQHETPERLRRRLNRTDGGA